MPFILMITNELINTFTLLHESLIMYLCTRWARMDDLWLWLATFFELNPTERYHCNQVITPGAGRVLVPVSHFALHTVLPQTDVRRSDFVVIFFHCTQNWTALNFAVSFRVLIQPYSSRLLNSFCRGGLDWLTVSESERQRTSGPHMRTFYDL